MMYEAKLGQFKALVTHDKIIDLLFAILSNLKASDVLETIVIKLNQGYMSH